MAYSLKFWADFESKKGVYYKLSIYEEGFAGDAKKKKLGSAPTLTIDEGSEGIKGTSISFNIQADVEGELQSLYAEDNKQFKVVLEKNNNTYWIGYILPEIYSEQYIAPPYNVTITATDQIAILKDVDFLPKDERRTLFDILNECIKNTGLELDFRIFTDAYPIEAPTTPYLQSLQVHDYTFGNKNCYEVITSILSSFNSVICQQDGKWLIYRVTDNVTDYYEVSSAGVLSSNKSTTTIGEIGELYKSNLHPVGSLTMVNSPAIRGVKLNSNVMLNRSLLYNPNIINRDYWTTTIYTSENYPDEFYRDGKLYKDHCFSFWPNTENYILAAYQDISIEGDYYNIYSLSLKYFFHGCETANPLLLMLVEATLENGEKKRLTLDKSWQSTPQKDSQDFYIQITGTDVPGESPIIAADKSNYSNITINFNLLEKTKSIRVGFINKSLKKKAHSGVDGWVNITDVYFQLANVYGASSTSTVAPKASQEQKEVELTFTDDINRPNSYLGTYNTLSLGENVFSSKWIIHNIEYDSYFLAMLQDFSKYLGSKKYMLQGIVSGKELNYVIYQDAFSKKFLRFKQGSMDLLNDELQGIWEEIISQEVDFDTTIESVASGQTIESILGSVNALTQKANNLFDINDENEVYTLQERDFRAKNLKADENIIADGLVIPQNAPTAPIEGEWFLYLGEGEWAENPSGTSGIDWDSLISYDGVSSHKINNNYLNVIPYAKLSGVAALSHTHVAADITNFPTALKNPFSLTFGSKTYDGSSAKTIVASDLGAITAHQSIYSLTIQKNSTTIGTYTPNSAAKTINISVPTTTTDIAEGANLYFTNTRAINACSASYLGISAKAADSNKLNGQLASYYATATALNNYLPLSGGVMKAPIMFDYNYNGNANVGRNSGFSLFYNISANAEEQGFPSRSTSVASFVSIYTGFQLATCGGTNHTTLYFREISEKSVWTDWFTILHSGNFANYCPKKDGTGAYGNWGINITGNAASATKLEKARTIWGQPFNGTANIETAAAATMRYLNFIRYDNITSSAGYIGRGAPDNNHIYLISEVGGVNIGANGNLADLRLNTSHNLGLGIDPTEKLDVNGNTKVRGNLTCNGLEIPTAPPTNPVAGKFYLWIE